jgi:predicted nucleotide-binding protein (sugar kinase/HSP70/actin superfamily)
MHTFPFEVISNVYSSYLLGGLLRRISCKIRPDEILPDSTDQLLTDSIKLLSECIANHGSKEKVFSKIVDNFTEIPLNQQKSNRPKAAIIGDLYVRDNDTINQNLIYAMENFGAEVVTTPYTFVLRILSAKHIMGLRHNAKYWSLVRHKLLIQFLEKFEKKFYSIAYKILNEDFPVFDEKIFDELRTYNLSLEHGGETVQNVLKIYSMLEHFPDLSLFVHVNPIFCCPGLVSESLFKKIEKNIGIPIVSITYDGTSTNHNDVLAPFIHFFKQSTKTIN